MPWFRTPGGEDAGIYSWMTQLTVTGPYVNVTPFEGAVVDMPGGAAMAALNSIGMPEAAAALIDFLAGEENTASFAAATRNTTAHQDLQASSTGRALEHIDLRHP
ncbi:hypothetical protein [Yoonia sp. I 8.24]|uniref:hypothetical protein n=1 Tax=Yoonia sp. I 8.24 TaxID=1537229 RepID=UPI001EDE19EA|nr:hypothetical protein [Yoonia sp. I 8.24]MCG3268273.1 hypothetical protein [Yoonia sp. I 8.24]